MGRGKGKGKGRGGGGKMFVANIEELQMREAQVEEAKMKRKNRRGDSDSEDDEGGSSDEEDTKVDPKDDLRELANFERASRLQKASGVVSKAEGDMEEEEPKPRGGLLGGFQTANTNHGSKNPKQMKTKDALKNMGNDVEVEQQMSRKEREAIEAQRKKADYERRHAAGETAEAKADLARLAEVRKRREEAKIKREKTEARQQLVEAGLPTGGSDDDDDDSDEEEEEEAPKKSKLSAEKKASNLAKKKAAAKGDTSDDIPVLTSIEIKKLKPDMLKDHLKKRGLSLQGQKKELITRLTEHEAARK